MIVPRVCVHNVQGRIHNEGATCITTKRPEQSAKNRFFTASKVSAVISPVLSINPAPGARE
jgi:hypothetical protein